MHAIARRLGVFALGAALAACGGDGPSGPSQPPLSAYAGTWTGTTSQNRNLTLWVGSTGVIDSIRVQVNVTIISGQSSCTVTYRPTEITITANRTFEAELSSSSGITGEFVGEFTSTTAADGTFEAGWNGSVICGNSFTFGSGGHSADGTWTATKS